MTTNSIRYTFEELVALFSIFVAIFVPTIADVYTDRFYAISEKSYLWPWLFLIRLQPDPIYATDQYNIITFPWSFILYIPFLYVIKLSLELFSKYEERAKKSSMIALASLIQIGVIALVFSSQNTQFATETKTIFYVPQLILLVVHGLLAVNWFYSDVISVFTRSSTKNTATAEIEN